MIIDFLERDIPPEELIGALNVIRHFKSCESILEYIDTMFVTWTKLEQLEEHLEHRVEGKPLKRDTLVEIQRRKETE